MILYKRPIRQEAHVAYRWPDNRKMKSVGIMAPLCEGNTLWRAIYVMRCALYQFATFVSQKAVCGYNLASSWMALCVGRTLCYTNKVNSTCCWKGYINLGLLNTHTHIMRQIFFFLYTCSQKLFLKFCNIDATPTPHSHPPHPRKMILESNISCQ